MKFKWKNFQTIGGRWMLEGRRALKTSFYHLCILLEFTGNCMMFGFRRPEFSSLYIVLCTNPFPIAQMGREVTQEVSLLGGRNRRKTFVTKEGL